MSAVKSGCWDKAPPEVSLSELSGYEQVKEHVFSISISISLYFVSFFHCFQGVFLSLGTDISISRQVLSFLSFTSMSGLFALIRLFVSLDWQFCKRYLEVSNKVVFLSLKLSIRKS